MSLQSYEDDETIIIRPDELYSWQTRRSAVSNKIGKLLSASLWNKLRNKMIMISCVIAISLDPLFLYIPFIDEEKKCLGMDKKLRNVALILRSLTDVTFLVHIGYQIYEDSNKAYKEINRAKEQWELDWQTTPIRKDEIVPFAAILATTLPWASLLIDLLSVFPTPQVLVVKVFYQMRGRRFLEGRMVVNFFLLSQYFPRIYLIILTSKKLKGTTGIKVKALFNLFLYILASHVLGAFWYFFSIQRETSCWYWACEKYKDHEGCMSTFYCDDGHNTSTKNLTFFNEFCGIDVPDNTKPPFDYGIFLDSLKLGNMGHFPTKLCYSFWWGLKNLSNFGTNLTTSNYVWENLFAILISITGMLLFVYLIGNVQTYIHMRTTKSDELKRNIKLIEQWMDKHRIPDDMKKEIMNNVNQKLEEGEDADLETLFNVLPWYTKKFLKQFLCLNILSQVELLKLMPERVLKMMCDCLTPVTYAPDHIIFPMGHPIDRMLLIIEGTVLTYSSSFTRGEETTKDSGVAPSPSMATEELERGYVYGEELLKWASPNKTGIDKLPTSNENVKCLTKVEGFVLSAKNLQLVVSESGQLWKLNVDP
ncbi:hypothetical protein L3X38_021768 [Prunus dulcis]|uniref:Cyclic nucleotide-binding domain-containing protein n=1 Tax=Prunus dulcis TaxID=3755 RepID=A0AAD4Z2X9_PRUDU|nr:hypothetical protein L3X38_021768 [Prunus dulcis]